MIFSTKLKRAVGGIAPIRTSSLGLLIALLWFAPIPPRPLHAQIGHD